DFHVTGVQTVLFRSAERRSRVRPSPPNAGRRRVMVSFLAPTNEPPAFLHTRPGRTISRSSRPSAVRTTFSALMKPWLSAVIITFQIISATGRLRGRRPTYLTVARGGYAANRSYIGDTADPFSPEGNTCFPE